MSTGKFRSGIPINTNISLEMGEFLFQVDGEYILASAAVGPRALLFVRVETSAQIGAPTTQWIGSRPAPPYILGIKFSL